MRKLAYIILISLTFVSCSQKKFKPRIANIKFDEKALYESYNATILISDDKAVRARVFTKHLVVYDDIKKTFLKDSVNIEFFGENGDKNFILTCKEGEIDDITHNMVARNNVYAYNLEGVKIRTEKLNWDNQTRQFHSDKFVTVITPSEKIQGYGFQSDSRIRNYVINKIVYITNSTSFSNE